MGTCQFPSHFIGQSKSYGLVSMGWGCIILLWERTIYNMNQWLKTHWIQNSNLIFLLILLNITPFSLGVIVVKEKSAISLVVFFFSSSHHFSLLCRLSDCHFLLMFHDFTVISPPCISENSHLPSVLKIVSQYFFPRYILPQECLITNHWNLSIYPSWDIIALSYYF